MTSPEPTATAHQAWDAIWRSEAGRADWLVPQPEVMAVAADRRAGGATAALDLGCGVGRHALALAAMGFRTTALDASPSGLGRLKQAAHQGNLSVGCLQAPMTAVPLADASQDYVVAWNVIYHGDPQVVARAIAEIHRVLRPGATYQGTMLAKRNKHFGIGRQVAPDTWVEDAASVGDKAHPHFFCDAAELCTLFAGFEVISLTQDEQGKPDHWHWHLVAQRH